MVTQAAITDALARVRGQKPPANTVTPIGVALPQFIRAKDVCAALQVSRRTLRNLARSGKFPKPIRVGRGVRWSVEAVRAFIESNEGTE